MIVNLTQYNVLKKYSLYIVYNVCLFVTVLFNMSNNRKYNFYEKAIISCEKEC